MQIQLNGETTEVADDLTMSQLIEQLELTGRRIAVEVNEDLVPRGQFDSYRLQADDRVEIVQAIGGG